LQDLEKYVSWKAIKLDEDGIVVAWYERAESRDFGESLVLHSHISQLYVPVDVALGVPV
jgi:hypothetical protein